MTGNQIGVTVSSQQTKETMEVSPTLRDERKRKVRLLYEVIKIKTHRLKPKMHKMQYIFISPLFPLYFASIFNLHFRAQRMLAAIQQPSCMGFLVMLLTKRISKSTYIINSRFKPLKIPCGKYLSLFPDRQLVKKGRK